MDLRQRTHVSKLTSMTLKGDQIQDQNSSYSSDTESDSLLGKNLPVGHGTDAMQNRLKLFSDILKRDMSAPVRFKSRKPSHSII